MPILVGDPCVKHEIPHEHINREFDVAERHEIDRRPYVVDSAKELEDTRHRVTSIAVVLPISIVRFHVDAAN
jgi:hypothetical protein